MGETKLFDIRAVKDVSRASGPHEMMGDSEMRKAALIKLSIPTYKKRVTTYIERSQGKFQPKRRS